MGAAVSSLPATGGRGWAGQQGSREMSVKQQDIHASPSWEGAFWSPSETPLTLLVAEGLMRGVLVARPRSHPSSRSQRLF